MYPPSIIYTIMHLQNILHQLLICVKLNVNYGPSYLVSVCVFMQYLCMSSLFDSLGLFSTRFPLLLHSTCSMPHFCGLTLICTDSCDACSLSAFHFIQSMLHGAVLTCISSLSPTFPFLSFFLPCYLALSNPHLPISPSLSAPLLFFLSRYFSPTPPPCLSAVATAPRLMAMLGPRPMSPWLPGNKKGESDPCIHLWLHRSITAAVLLSASPSFSCYSAFFTFPPTATHGERRAVEEVAATTSPFHSPLHTTWPCQTCCVASASLSSWWATQVKWGWPGLGRRRTSCTWRPTWRC